MNALPAARLAPRDAAVSTAPRSLALDVFRGLTVALMLLVNNLALDRATPALLLHAPWGGGVRLADLVFPWFLFATGLSLPFAYASQQRRDPRYRVWVWKALQRAFWLFALGCLVTSVVARGVVISLGVLQLIGLAFLVAALLHPLPIMWRGAIAAALLIAYWLALRFLPIPGMPAGTFEEGSNLVHFINNAYLEPVGLRGLASVIPTGAMVLIAACIGALTRRSGAARVRAAWLFGIGALLAVAGTIWDLDLEMNKTVWTPSYILFTAGLVTALLGALTYLETLRWRSWSFAFVVFGSNALVAYVAPIIVKVLVLQSWTVAPGLTVQGWWLEVLRVWAGAVGGGWLYTASYLLAVWLGLYLLYRQRWFLRV